MVLHPTQKKIKMKRQQKLISRIVLNYVFRKIMERNNLLALKPIVTHSAKYPAIVKKSIRSKDSKSLVDLGST